MPVTTAVSRCETASALAESRNDGRRVVADPTAPYFGAHVSERSLIPEGDSPRGEVTLDTWLEASAK